jgi:hypothetical protein
VDEIFNDPDFRARMDWYASTHGKDNKKAGQSSGGMNTIQNGQFPVGGTPMGTPTQNFNQQAQTTAAEGQSAAMMGAM